MTPTPGVQPDRIDVNVSQEQLREAVAAVGDKAADVEMHLKGARSTTNADRVRELGSS